MTKWLTVQKMYSEMHSTLCAKTHHDVTIVEADVWLKIWKMILSRTEHNFWWNKKIVKSCPIDYIFRSYYFFVIHCKSSILYVWMVSEYVFNISKLALLTESCFSKLLLSEYLNKMKFIFDKISKKTFPLVKFKSKTSAGMSLRLKAKVLT